MRTIAPHIHSEHYWKLKNAIAALEAGEKKRAERLTERIKSALQTFQLSPDEMQALIFTEALIKRLDDHSPEVGNLYLDKGQHQIEMFDLMAIKFPVVKLAQDIVNTVHAVESQTEKNIIILDIGIGSGQQIARLLERISEANLEKLTVIGIEPAVESLLAAQKLLEETCREKPVAFEFIAIPKVIEELTMQDWFNLSQRIRDINGKLLINASFALHHVRPAGLRPYILHWLKRLNPAVFTLIEPYADFLTTNLVERFDNAWHHYGLTFDAIDKIDASQEEKNALKNFFFSQEVRDVLAIDERRTEQMETAEMWFQRVGNVGFKPYPLNNQAFSFECLVSNYPFLGMRQNPRFIEFEINGFPIVSILIQH